MTEPWSRVAVVVLGLVVLGAVGAVAGTPAGEPRPADAATPAPNNDSAAAVVATQGAALSTPVGSSDRGVYRRMGTFVAAYNDEQPDLGVAGRLVRGNLVNLHVTGPDGEATVVSFRLTEDNRIEDVRAGPRADAPIRIDTDVATFERVATAPRPGEAFRRALADGDVTTSGRGLGSSVIWSIVNLLSGLSGGG